LLEELRRLGKGIEKAFIDPAGNQIIPGPFRCTLGEKGGFNFDKTLFVQIVPDGRCDKMAFAKGPKNLGATQFQVTVFQA
jgi:hypothetical protein